uniref:Uncharacterized protein n=1 Tax=Spodoptera frugiperda ascovirus 1a TaxID=113370 RepID=Q9DKL8_SFAVA|nr:hypothetical protein [Spodoptera frugiperda ascovirus 1a]
MNTTRSDTFRSCIGKCRCVFEYGTIDWSGEAFPHVPRTISSTWLQTSDPRRYRLQLVDELIDLIEQQRPVNALHSNSITILHAALAEACAVATSKHLSVWVCAELILARVPGTYGIMRTIGGVRDHHSVAVFSTHPHMRLTSVIDPTEGAYLRNYHEIHKTHSRILNGTIRNDNRRITPLVYALRPTTVFNTPTLGRDRELLAATVRHYVDDLRRHKCTIVGTLTDRIVGSCPVDFAQCLDDFITLMHVQMNRLSAQRFDEMRPTSCADRMWTSRNIPRKPWWIESCI